MDPSFNYRVEHSLSGSKIVVTSQPFSSFDNVKSFQSFDVQPNLTGNSFMAGGNTFNIPGYKM